MPMAKHSKCYFKINVMFLLQALARRSTQQRYGSLVDPLGEVDSVVVRSIFDEFDTNQSGTIEGKELQGLLLGLQLGGADGKVDKETMDFWVKVRGGGLS